MRSSETALEMWKEVLERSLPGKSRAQDEINQVTSLICPRFVYELMELVLQILGTTELRQPATMDEPLRTDFVAANGLRVHVLDPATFRPINLQCVSNQTTKERTLIYRSHSDSKSPSQNSAKRFRCR
jgi:hypothetical protein